MSGGWPGARGTNSVSDAGRPPRSFAKVALFAAVLALFSALLLELALAAAALASPAVERLLGSPWASPTIPDARLRHRGNPAFPEHDARGFRNPEAVAQARGVALGDSQTYGTGVGPEDAWPRRLEALRGERWYGMGFGGYGPPHSLLLWDEAMALEPEVVIEAFYLGNDLFDSFDLVYGHGQLPELRSDDPTIRDAIERTELAEPLTDRVNKLLYMGKDPNATQVAAAEEAAGAEATSPISLARRVAEHSNIFGLLRRLRFEIARRMSAGDASGTESWAAAQAFAAAHSEYCQVFSDGQFQTVFTSEYRLNALDLDDARIAEGLAIALRSIDRMAERALAREIRLLVIVIPTKEAVFRDRWESPTPAFERLAENERRAMALVEAHLRDRGIELLDASTALRAELAAGNQPYPVSQDGHPNAVGHRAIAEAVAARLAL